jgi:oligopeptide transport system substrate-binding protein
MIRRYYLSAWHLVRKVSKQANPGLTGLCLLASLLLVACGGLSPEEIDAMAEQIAVPLIATHKAGAPTPIAGTKRTPSPAPTVTPVHTPLPTRGNLADSQVLRLAACCPGSDSLSIDPAMVSWDPTSKQIVTEAFVGLMRQNEETAAVEPGMAVAWDVSADRLVWTFQLRDDVPWVRYNPATQRVDEVTDEADQNPRDQVRYVTAYDFEYGIMRILDPDTDSDNAHLLYLIEGAEDFHTGDGSASSVGIKALNDTTLEIRLAQPAGYFDVIVGTWNMVGQPGWQIEAEGDDWVEASNFQSYGPYVLKEWVDDSHLTLVKNPYWPGTESIPRPTIEEITWTLMEDVDALAAYEAGDLDVTRVLPDALTDVQANQQLAAQLAAQPSLCAYYAGFNTLKPPFDDPRVRLAFSQAVDRQALIDDVLQSGDEVARWFSPVGARAVPTVEEYATLGVAYDPDEASALLDLVYPDRSQMESITLASASHGSHPEMAAALQAQWEDVLGVEVELELIDNFGDYLDLIQTDAPQVWRLGWCAYHPDAHYFLSDYFHSDSANNYTNWSSGEFDSLVDEAALSTDTAARTEWYAQAEDLLVRQEAAIIPLRWSVQSALTQPHIQRTYSRLAGIERFEKWAVLAR